MGSGQGCLRLLHFPGSCHSQVSTKMSTLTWAWGKRGLSGTILGNRDRGRHGRQARQTLPELGLPTQLGDPALLVSLP